MDKCQKSLNVILLRRGEFELSFGGLNNNIPYTVQQLLQLALPWVNQNYRLFHIT